MVRALLAHRQRHSTYHCMENSRGRGRSDSGKKEKKNPNKRPVLWFRWDDLDGGVRADAYPLLCCVKPGWGSRAASGQAEREAKTTIQADRQSAQMRCPHLCRLGDHDSDVYNLR